jgi:hypothetical protein
MATETMPETSLVQPAGKRFECQACGAQIEIIKPCTCDPPDQVFQCCAQAMRPVDRT